MLLPTRFKSGKAIDYLSHMKAYIVKNYDTASFSPEVEKFLTEVQQNRNVICNMSEFAQNIDAIHTNKEILIQYINNLNLIKTKMTFGKEDYCVKIEFMWKDIFKDSKWTSYSIGLEYYSCIFNLAVMYYKIAQNDFTIAAGDENLLKEVNKKMQFASGLFELIKKEAGENINVKEMPYDLTQSYMSFCMAVCAAFGQVCVARIAEKRASTLDLQAQVYYGAAQMFGNAANLCEDPGIKKFSDEATKSFLFHRKYYYEAIAYSKLRTKAKQFFDSNGTNFGHVLCYQFGIVSSLEKTEQFAKKCQNLISNYKNTLNYKKESDDYRQMEEDNRKIYFNSVPEFETFAKITSKIMFKPMLPPDYKTDPTEIKELDALVPKEAKEMISKYKDRMMNTISEKLNSFENETSIDQFLSSMDLPNGLNVSSNASKVSDELWQKVELVQQKGCANYIINLVQQLEQLPMDIEKRINSVGTLLQNEAKEDQRYREEYKGSWNRKPSFEVNGQYFNTLNDYLGKLNMARNCDEATKNEIRNILQHFDFLSQTREALDAKVPQKSDSNAFAKQKEVVELKKDVDEILRLKDEMMLKINDVFKTLNEDSSSAQFLKVLQKTTTENQIFDNNKAKYDELFNEIESVNNEIKKLKDSIQTKNEAFVKFKTNKMKPNPENDNYLKKLEDSCISFFQKENQLKQGLNFYSQFNGKMVELNKKVSNFLMERDMEKNKILQGILSGNTSGPTNVKEENKRNFNDLYCDFTKDNKQQPQQGQFGQQQQPNQFGQQPRPYGQQQGQFGQQQQPNQFGQQPRPYGQQQGQFGQQQQPNQFGQQPRPYGQQQPQQNQFGGFNQQNNYPQQPQQRFPYQQQQQQQQFGQFGQQPNQQQFYGQQQNPRF